MLERSVSLGQASCTVQKQKNTLLTLNHRKPFCSFCPASTVYIFKSLMMSGFVLYCSGSNISVFLTTLLLIFQASHITVRQRCLWQSSDIKFALMAIPKY